MKNLSYFLLLCLVLLVCACGDRKAYKSADRGSSTGDYGGITEYRDENSTGDYREESSGELAEIAVVGYGEKSAKRKASKTTGDVSRSDESMMSAKISVASDMTAKRTEPKHPKRRPESDPQPQSGLVTAGEWNEPQ